MLIDHFSSTPHLADPLGVNLQLLLELADGSVLLLQLLHQILKQAEGRSDGEGEREK